MNAVAMKHETDGKGSIRVDELYDTDVADLWSAITQPERLARWIAEVSGDLRLGGEVHARFTSSWDGPVRIDVCEPPHRLRVTMGPEADDVTTIEAWVSAEGSRARLVIEEHGLPRTDLPYHGAGWQAHMEDLAAHLAGRDASDWGTRWRELTPDYLATAV